MRGLLLLFFVLPFVCFAQNNRETEIREVISDSFPLISGKFWIRDTSRLKIETVVFTELQDDIKVQFSNPLSATPKPAKSIVFLLENHWNFPIPTAYYKDVVIEALKMGIMKEGDEYAIICYDCLRPPYGQNKQLLFPDILYFKNSKNELIKEISSLKRPDIITGNQCVNDAQMYKAIYMAINLLASYNTENQKGIVVLAKDFSVTGEVSAADVGDFARQSNIPVYGIMYNAGYHGKFSAKEICERSFGDYWISSDFKNKPTIGAKVLLSFMANFLNKAAGVEYDFSYITTTSKDGFQHLVQVKTPYGTDGFSYNAPAKTIVEKLRDNLFLVIIGILVFAAMIIFIAIKMHKRKKNQLLKDEELRETQKKIEEQKEFAEFSKKEMDAKWRSIEEKEANRITELEKQKQKEQEDIENSRLILEMLKKGSFARLVYAKGSELGTFQLSQPFIKIGRNPTNHFHINHGTVSREHASIQFVNSCYMIEDLGSSNGTFVNGVRVNREKLNDGDHIAFGEIAVTFHS